MSTCLIIYYSQSGTTEKAARHIAQGLQSCGVNVELFNLQEGRPAEILNCDLLGVGSPVYFFNPVFEVKTFLYRLPDLKGMPVFTFVSYGTEPGKALPKMQTILGDKGAKNIGSFSCRNANFIFGFRRPGMHLGLDQIPADELQEAIKFGIKLAAYIQTK